MLLLARISPRRQSAMQTHKRNTAHLYQFMELAARSAGGKLAVTDFPTLRRAAVL